MKNDAAVEEPTDPTAGQAEFLDRDLSWLEFNRRVLHEALDDRTPTLERLMFLGIFTSNLDEFFMKRVGLLGRKLANSEQRQRRLATVRETILPMVEQQTNCYEQEIRPVLAKHGIHLLRWDEMNEEEAEVANRYFRDNVFPVLTPQSVDQSHPFPFMSNLSTSLAIALSSPNGDEKLFARVKVPKTLPQWIEVAAENRPGGERRFAYLQDIIQANLPELFPGMTILDVMPVRVTRSAYLDYEEDDVEDLLELVAEEVRQRRLLHVVRLEHNSTENSWLLDKVVKQLDLSNDQVYERQGVLNYCDFSAIAGLKVPELKYSSWTPVVTPAFSGDDADMFALIRAGDVIVHHPYESFDASVLRFIRAAVDDENVLAIKMTVYRTSDDSPFMPLLIHAAETGKQVACLVELKARFDEQRNIRWANALEDAGVHVVYGVMGVKTHAKTCIVVRREPDGLRCYAHIGTGNYNSQTAKLYTDLGMFTCNPDVTADVVALFHSLTGRSLKHNYRKLLVAPVNMKERFLSLIEREAEHHAAGRPAQVIGKMNQLEDPQVIRALYAASQVGVPIDMIVRGFCTMRPGVPGLSPTINVTSIIGRFLEHSRVFYFRNGQEDPLEGEFYLGSADWMSRNLNDRVEAITPVEMRSLRERLWEILSTMLVDQRQAWEMNADGAYRQRTPVADAAGAALVGTQQYLMDRVSGQNTVEPVRTNAPKIRKRKQRSK